MAARAGSLLQWAREARGNEQLQADEGLLHEIQAFLLSREAESARSATHTVLENYPDWWVRNRRAPCGLEISGQEDQEALYRYAGALYGMGIPLTLGERRTEAFRFFQDIEAWGTKETSMPSSELVGPETALARVLGGVIAEVFPNHPGFLDAALYDATGMSQTKGVRKTSVRLIWPGVVVDSDRAARVRDLLVHRLATAAAQGGPVADLEAQLLKYSPLNAWHSVCGDAAYGVRAIVRMPLSDRVSPQPLRAPERRPLSPVGVIRFTFGAGEGKMKAEWLCREGELDHGEWVKIGCLRQSANTQLTEWSSPSWPGNGPAPPSAARAGRAKVRTAAGSDGGGGLRIKGTSKLAPPERAGQLLTVERTVSGAMDQFRDKMDLQLGKPELEADGSWVWRQPGGDARIVLYTADRRIRIIGKPNQVRSLVVIVAPHTEGPAGLGPGAWQDLPASPRGEAERDLDGTNGHAAPRAPSEAYAPPDSRGGNRDGGAPSPSSGEEGGAALGGQLRQAGQDFLPEGQGELELRRGDVVCISHDPEGENGGSDDRWVYGRCEASGLSGWFPLSHTSPLEETTQPQVP